MHAGCIYFFGPAIRRASPFYRTETSRERMMHDLFPSNLIECNCPRISKHWMVWTEGFIAFQTELRFPNVSFSVCNYLKPYLNPIKEHTILIVICTNEVFAIVIAAMRVSVYISIRSGKPITFPFSPALSVNRVSLCICLVLL